MPRDRREVLILRDAHELAAPRGCRGARSERRRVKSRLQSAGDDAYAPARQWLPDEGWRTADRRRRPRDRRSTACAVLAGRCGCVRLPRTSGLVANPFVVPPSPCRGLHSMDSRSCSIGSETCRRENASFACVSDSSPRRARDMAVVRTSAAVEPGQVSAARCPGLSRTTAFKGPSPG
jgi:hypothetical protein